MTPNLIICAGMHRSGSTWLYNVVRYCCMNAGLRTYGDYAKKYRDTIPADVHVLKIHPFKQHYCDRAKHVFTTVRDLRDVVASMIRYNITRPTPRDVAHSTEKLINREYAAWAPYSSLEIRYEEMVLDRPAAVAAVLRVLDLPSVVDPVEVHRDVEKLTRMALPDLDRTTQLWPRHVTNGRTGSYAETLSPELIKIVENIGGSWLTEHGYELLHIAS